MDEILWFIVKWQKQYTECNVLQSESLKLLFFFFSCERQVLQDSVYRRYLFHKNLKKVYDSQPSSITFCINCEISFTAFNLKSWLKTRNCIDFLNYKLVLIGATSAGFGNFCLKSYFVDLYIWLWKRFSDLLMFGL